jgi:hypothetical protein
MAAAHARLRLISRPAMLSTMVSVKFWECERTKLAFDWARQLARELAGASPSKQISKIAFAAAVERAGQADRAFGGPEGRRWSATTRAPRFALPRHCWRQGKPAPRSSVTLRILSEAIVDTVRVRRLTPGVGRSGRAAHPKLERTMNGRGLPVRA